MCVGGQRHAPAVLTPEKILYPLYNRQGGLRVALNGCEKFRPHSNWIPGQPTPWRVTISEHAESFNVYIPLFGVCYFVRWVS